MNTVFAEDFLDDEDFEIIREFEKQGRDEQEYIRQLFQQPSDTISLIERLITLLTFTNDS